MRWIEPVVVAVGLVAGVVGAGAGVVAVLDSRRSARRTVAAPDDPAAPSPASSPSLLVTPVTAFGAPNGPAVEAPVSWGQWETDRLAARWVQRGLAAARNYAAVAVDSGVVLHRAPDLGEPLDLATVDVVYSGAEQPLSLVDPSARQLGGLIRQQVTDDGVRRYLLHRAEAQARATHPGPNGRPIDGNHGDHRTKVGLRHVDRPSGRTSTRLTLSLAPLSYWVVKNFNRELAKLWGHDDPERADPELFGLRKRALPPILAPDEIGVPLRGPSPLFVEVTLVTADGKLAVLRKSSPGSVLASVSRCWTCSLEEGVEWRHLVDHGGFDPVAVAVEGAGIELGLGPEAIGDVWFSALGLEYTHLATALLGTMVLRTTADELRPGVDASADFEDVRFVDLDGAAQALFPVGPHPDGWHDEKSWHPTGRLRALLTLHRLQGRDAVRRQL